MVSAAVQPSLLVEVDEVDEELPADAAGEATWVPAGVRSGPGREHAYVARRQGLLALQNDTKKGLRGF